MLEAVLEAVRQAVLGVLPACSATRSRFNSIQFKEYPEWNLRSVVFGQDGLTRPEQLQSSLDRNGPERPFSNSVGTAS